MALISVFDGLCCLAAVSNGIERWSVKTDADIICIIIILIIYVVFRTAL